MLASGADTLVSIGGYQSNHTRQVAAVAAHLGLKCRLVQEKWVPWDDPTNTQVGNILLSRMMGADSRLDPHGFDIGIRDSWKDAIREVEESGGTPYAIPAGASEHRLGGLGFANWAFEVAEQEKSLGITFDTIVVCTVTGSTHAGMIAGFAALEDLTGVRRRVIGIDASATLEKTRDQVARIARSTAELISSAATCATTRSPCSTVGRRALRRAGRLDDGGDGAGRPARGDDHRPRLRGEVARRTGRPRRGPRHPGRLARALRPPRRAAGHQRLPLPLARAGLSASLTRVYDDALAWAGSVLGAPWCRPEPLEGGMTSTMLTLRDDGGSESVLRLMTNEPWRTHGAELAARERRPSWPSPGPPSRRRPASALDADGTATGVPAHLMSRLPGSPPRTR